MSNNHTNPNGYWHMSSNHHSSIVTPELPLGILSKYLLTMARSRLSNTFGFLNCHACKLVLQPVGVRSERVVMLVGHIPL
jgi:hypothetical protein